MNLSDLTLLGQNWKQTIAGFLPAGIIATSAPATPAIAPSDYGTVDSSSAIATAPAMPDLANENVAIAGTKSVAGPSAMVTKQGTGKTAYDRLMHSKAAAVAQVFRNLDLSALLDDDDDASVGLYQSPYDFIAASTTC